MKKVLLTSLTAVLAVSAANAGVYVGGYASTAWNQSERSEATESIDLNFTLGYAFENGIRLEADVLSYNLYSNDTFGVYGQKFDKDFFQKIGIDSVKGFYDFKLDSKWSPYVGLGIVMNLSHFANTGLAVNTNKDTYSVYVHLAGIAGVSYQLTEKVALDAQYSRVEGLMKTKGQDFDNEGYNEVRLGARYAF